MTRPTHELVTFRTIDETETRVTTRQLHTLLKLQLQNSAKGYFAYVIDTDLFLYNLQSDRVEHTIPNVHDVGDVKFISDTEVAASITTERVFIYDVNLSRITKVKRSEDIYGSTLLAFPENILMDGLATNEIILWNTATHEMNKLQVDLDSDEDSLIDILKVDDNQFSCQFEKYVTVGTIMPFQHLRKLSHVFTDMYFSDMWSSSLLLITDYNNVQIVNINNDKIELQHKLEALGDIDIVHKINSENAVIVHSFDDVTSHICTWNTKTNKCTDFVVPKIPRESYYEFEDDMFVYVKEKDLMIYNVQTQKQVHCIKDFYNDPFEILVIKPKF